MTKEDSIRISDKEFEAVTGMEPWESHEGCITFSVDDNHALRVHHDGSQTGWRMKKKVWEQLKTREGMDPEARRLWDILSEPYTEKSCNNCLYMYQSCMTCMSCIWRCNTGNAYPDWVYKDDE